MMNGTPFQRYSKQITTSLLHSFLYSCGHLTCFPFAHTYAAITITYYCQCSKAHGTATFDDFTDAVYRDHFFTQAVFAILIGMSALCFSHLIIPCLELQASFTRGLCQRLYAAMITEARTIESDALYTGCLGFFSHTLAN